jgi:hydrogenase nickel incorporation protein HypB
MGAFKTIKIKKSVDECSAREAQRLRGKLKEDGAFLLNLLPSPRSGNTATLVRAIVAFKDELRIGVRAAEIDSDVDARTSQCAGVAQAIRLHTDGMCCLNADMPTTVLRA